MPGILLFLSFVTKAHFLSLSVPRQPQTQGSPPVRFWLPPFLSLSRSVPAWVPPPLPPGLAGAAPGRVPTAGLPDLCGRDSFI